jgi:NAD(P)-dependent dehydrogenase (short-subunit alcohol dehydrogenase family)
VEVAALRALVADNIRRTAKRRKLALSALADFAGVSRAQLFDVLASRKAENLERVAEEVRALGRTAFVVPTDVRAVDECEALIDNTLAELGRIDVLVNNAGGSHNHRFEAWTPAYYQNMLDLNLRSVFVLSHRVAPHMEERGSGSIVNVSSGAAAQGLPDVAPYGAAKAGVENLTKSFAAALGPKGIRVNCVRVGAVKSEGFVRAMEKVGRDPDVVGGSASALGRAGDPEEIAWPIVFFASDASSYISGETVFACGGPRSPTPPIPD